MALADRNRDGQLTAKEREKGDAVALLQRGGVPLLDDTADGSRGSALMHSKILPIATNMVCLCYSTFTPPQVVG